MNDLSTETLEEKFISSDLACAVKTATSILHHSHHHSHYNQDQFPCSSNSSYTKSGISNIISPLISAVVWHQQNGSDIHCALVLLKELAQSYDDIGILLISRLTEFIDPIPFIEILPELFCLNVSLSSTAQVYGTLRDILKTSSGLSSLVLPIVNALVELPGISSSQLEAILTSTTLSAVHETDMPALFRILIKCSKLMNGPPTEIVALLRHELALSSGDALCLVVEVMWELFPVAHKFVDCFIAQIMSDSRINYVNGIPV